MSILSLLTHPLLLALIALPLAFCGAAWALGAYRTERDEARAGVSLLCSMRWNEFCRLISEMLKDRGMQPANAERAPGKDGFDLLFTRGKSRYLVLCKNATGQRIDSATVGQLYTLTQMQDADGAIITSCAAADPAAMKLAQDRRIEVIADLDLWRHVKPWVAHDQRTDAETAAAAIKRRRLLSAALIALIAAMATYTVAALTTVEPASPSITPPNTPATPAAPVPASPSQKAIAALPEANLSEEKLASRRASTVLEVRGLTRVAHAAWSTRSTLQINLHDAITDADLVVLVTDVCRSLLQYEELRYTRLQLEVPTGNSEQPMRVRWRQCR